MVHSSRDYRPSVKPSSRASLESKEDAMYSSGFVAAVIIGLLALVSPMLWIGWWLIADLGERVNGTEVERAEQGLRRAA
jgi:hypothetical protein